MFCFFFTSDIVKRQLFKQNNMRNNICLSGTRLPIAEKLQRLQSVRVHIRGERRGYRGLLLSFCPKGLISNSPHCLLQNSYDVSLENFVLDQLRILLSISSILITCSLDIVCFFFFFFFLQFYRFVIIATSRLFLKYLYLISLIDLPILTITSFGFTAPS